MISSLVDLGDLGAPAVARGKAWHIGRSRIEAFSARIIELETRERDDCAEAWIGETGDPFPPAAPDCGTIEAYRDHRGCEGIKLYLRHPATGPLVEIARTYTGGCPVYVSSAGTRLCVSWKFEEAVANLPSAKPNLEACRIYLREATGHVREQVIDGVFMLWPGESLQFDAAGLRFRTIDPPLIVQPGTLHETADACGAFLRTVAAAMQPVLAKADKPLIELSGGFDSSCVGLAARLLRDDLHSYGLIQQGAIGIQQRKRRCELVALLGVVDFEYPSFIDLPLDSLQFEECRTTPFDDIYRQPCVSAVDRHPAGGFDCIVTGIGGDELTKENTHFRLAYELPGHGSRSAGTAAAGRADMFMRRGIWPISPLATPGVIDFCRGLPQALRCDRMLNVLTLSRAGLSDGFIFPRYKEHYANVSNYNATMFDYDASMENSTIEEWGIANIGELLARARDATLSGFDGQLRARLFLMLKLEAILRRYVRADAKVAVSS